MKKKSLTTIALLVACISACATAPVVNNALPPDIAGDFHHLTYDGLQVSVETPFESHLSLAIEGGGQAARDGFKMMAASPIGCLGASVYAGVCMAAAPFFPIIAAARAEDPAVAHAELEAFFGRVEDYGLQEKLTNRLAQRIDEQRLPAVQDDSAEDGNNMTVNVIIPPLELEHSGCKKGGIDMTMRYIAELAGGDGNVVARKSGKVSHYFSEDSRSITLYPQLDAWLDRIVEQSIDKMIVEWQPQIELGYEYPGKTKQRRYLWRKYVDWAPVGSLTPRISWQALGEVMPAERMAGITELSYEVDIYAVKYTVRPAPTEYHFVAKAQGLKEPAYQLESELLPCMRYYWKPRARFRYNGVMRTTSSDTAYLLMTPGPDCKSPAYVMGGYSD